MFLFKVLENLFLFQRPNENSDRVSAGSDAWATLRIGEIVISYDSFPEGGPLFDGLYPTNYDWHLIVSQNGFRGWVAESNGKQLYLEELI